MKRRFPMMTVAAVLAALASSAPTQSTAAPRYKLVDLGAPEVSWRIYAQAINDVGQVVGTFYDGRWPHAFLWQNGSMQVLPDLAMSADSAAFGINSAGTVVGNSNGFRGAQWSNGVVTDLNLLPGGQYLMGAGGINDRGQAVGLTWAPGAGQAPALITATGVVELPSPFAADEWGFARAINNAGVSVGYSGINAVMWFDQTPVVLGPGVAQAVNERNSAAGGAKGVDAFGFVVAHAALWRPGEATQLLGLPPGFVGSYAHGINDADLVVGVVGTDRYDLFGNLQGGSQQAVLWENGEAHLLSDLVEDAEGWTFFEARDINNRNQIVGSGLYQGQIRVFLLSPVPEPSLLSMLLVGMGWIAWACARRSRAR